MRAECAVFFWNSEPDATLAIDRSGDRRQLRAGLNANPENARRLCGREEAVAAEV
jgi:hypothetical protein